VPWIKRSLTINAHVGFRTLMKHKLITGLFFEEYDSSRGKSSSFITIYMPDIKNHHWKIFSDISSPMFPIYSHIGI
jgi:hypothetical protein